MRNIGYIIDELLRIHIYNSMGILWISYQPFDQPGPVLPRPTCVISLKCIIQFVTYTFLAFCLQSRITSCIGIDTDVTDNSLN